MIDLRSDTVTRPTAGHARAPWPPPTSATTSTARTRRVNRLQERVAALLGKEAALWLPSGTMANQVALRVLTRPGDDVIVGRESHAVWHETGGSAANAGVQFTEIGERRRVRPPRTSSRPSSRASTASTRRRRWSRSRTRTTAAAAWSSRRRRPRRSAPRRASSASPPTSTARGCGTPRSRPGQPVAELAAPFDLVAVSLSKGLGAPGGSLLAGPRDLIATRRAPPPHARRRDAPGRHLRGSAARTRSITTCQRLAERPRERPAHRRAARRRRAGIELDLATVQTNIVVFSLAAGAPDAARVVAAARERGVLVNALGAAPHPGADAPRRDAGRSACEAAEVLAAAASA